VDGETFNVKISPISAGSDDAPEQDRQEVRPKKRKDASPDAVVPGMSGVIVSIPISVGQVIEPGDLLATIEAMKMMRDVEAPHGGVVKEICLEEGEMIESEDILMVVEPNHG
jgi:biotin carboxyl carrier protein